MVKEILMPFALAAGTTVPAYAQHLVYSWRPDTAATAVTFRVPTRGDLPRPFAYGTSPAGALGSAPDLSILDSVIGPRPLCPRLAFGADSARRAGTPRGARQSPRRSPAPARMPWCANPPRP